MTQPSPVAVVPSRFGHMYAGGARITALRGVAEPAGAQGRSPEEWVVSTTLRWGATPPGDRYSGLSQLADGRLLAAAVAEQPEAWLGPTWRGRASGSTAGASDIAAITDIGLLVKLLDPAQRLPVHAHPSRAWASLHLGAPYGKTEAWYIVDAPAGGGLVHLGFTETMTAGDLVDHARRGGGDLVSLCRPLTVVPGDVVVVTAGLPHAIGEGIFVVEVQEPSDQSLLLEWQGVISVPESAATLGATWEQVADAVRLDPVGDDELAVLVSRPEPVDGRAVEVFGAAEGFFRGWRVTARTSAVGFDQGLAGVVVIEGAGRLTWDGGNRDVRTGDVIVVPWSAGEWSLSGVEHAIVARP